MAPYPAERDFKMVYCLLSLRIIGSIYINHFETPTHLNYVGHNPKKRYPYPARSLEINRLGFTMTWPFGIENENGKSLLIMVKIGAGLIKA